MPKNQQLSDHLSELASLRRQEFITLRVLVEELINHPEKANEIREDAIEQLANFKELADHIKKEYPKKRKRRLEFERALGCVIG